MNDPVFSILTGKSITNNYNFTDVGVFDNLFTTQGDITKELVETDNIKVKTKFMDANSSLATTLDKSINYTDMTISWRWKQTRRSSQSGPNWFINLYDINDSSVRKTGFRVVYYPNFSEVNSSNYNFYGNYSYQSAGIYDGSVSSWDSGHIQLPFNRINNLEFNEYSITKNTASNSIILNYNGTSHTITDNRFANSFIGYWRDVPLNMWVNTSFEAIYDYWNISYNY